MKKILLHPKQGKELNVIEIAKAFYNVANVTVVQQGHSVSLEIDGESKVGYQNEAEMYRIKTQKDISYHTKRIADALVTGNTYFEMKHFEDFGYHPQDRLDFLSYNHGLSFKQWMKKRDDMYKRHSVNK